MSDLKPGDHVNWNSTAGTIEGTVVKKVTSDTQIKSHHVNASEEDPQFIVKSDSTGAVAAHKPDAIHKDQKKSKSPKKAPKKTKEAKEDEDDDEEEEEKETKKPAKKENAGSSGSSGVSSRTRSRSGTLQAKPKKSQKEESDDDEEEEEEEDEKPKKKREAPKKKASASPKKKKTKTDKESSQEEKKEDKKKASKASKEEEEEKSEEKSEGTSKKESSNSQEKKEESHGSDDKDEIVKDFQSLINMSAEEIESWLKTEDSKNTGMTREGESEAVGHQSGGKIVEMLRTKPEEWTEEQVQHARKVRSYIKRHSAQRPDKDDLEHTKWTFSLKNWGHDPMKN